MQPESGHHDLRDVQSAVRIVVRPYASALPLGCFAFGIGNILLGVFILHWIPVAEKSTMAAILLAFVAPLELIACVMAFLSRDTGAATAMGIFAAGWVVQGLQLLGGDPSVPNFATGFFLLLLSVCLIILTVASFSGKPLLGVLLSTAILRSICAAVGQFGVHGPLDVVAAVLDAVLGLLAFYAGLAFLLEDIKEQPIGMTFRRNDAKEAMEGDLQQQMKHVSNEAGVRQQL